MSRGQIVAFWERNKKIKKKLLPGYAEEKS
jgi:hypothetical protein